METGNTNLSCILLTFLIKCAFWNAFNRENIGQTIKIPLSRAPTVKYR